MALCYTGLRKMQTKPETIDADPPMVYMQPHAAHTPPRLHVGSVIVEISDKGRAAHWMKILADYLVSKS